MPDNNSRMRVRFGTLDEYKKIPSKDTNTLYFLTDVFQMYLGDHLYSSDVLCGTAAPTMTVAPNTLYVKYNTDGSGPEIYHTVNGKDWLILISAKHTHSTSEVSGLSKVATTNDFNDLTNLPFYPSPFNITWDGNTTGLVYTTTTEVPDLGSVLYYQLYNTPPNSNIVEGSKVTMIAGDTPYTLVVMSENIIDDGNNNYHLLFPAFNELLPLVFCISTPDTITVESNGASFTITFEKSGVYLVNSFGSYISEFYKESKKLDEELLPDIVLEKNKCPQLPIGVYSNGYIYDYVNYIILSNYTNAYYDSITSDSFTIPVFMNDNVTSTNGTVSLKIVTEIDTSSLSVSRYVDVSVEIAKLYDGKSYLVLASKQSDGSWKGKVIGNVDIPIDSSPTSGSENLITSGGVYTAINEAIGTALGGSY